MSSEMQAVCIDAYGDNRVVNLHVMERPEPRAGEVLVKVHAAGVNPLDWKIRSGAGQRMGLTLPICLGVEISGTVERIGNGVQGLQQGDAVYGVVASGGFAEYVVASVSEVARVPDHLDKLEAAALALGALTAWQAMFDVANLSQGQHILITNGSGGVGSLAVQLASLFGAHVTALASARHESYVRSLGAETVIAYNLVPFETVTRDMDVVFDLVGGETFERAEATLKSGGCLVTAVAFPSDQGRPRNVRVVRMHCRPNVEQLTRIAALAEAGKIKPRIAKVFSLRDVKDALHLSESGQAGGKIVLRIGPQSE